VSAAGVPGAPDEPLDVVDVLLADHRTVDLLFDQLLEGTATASERRRDVADVLVAELMRHSAAEEQYVYPAARRYLPGGDALADRELQEHNRAEELMDQLMDTDADDPRFAPLVVQLAREIRAHVRHEEGDLFPRLRAAVDRGTLVRLATEVMAAKKLAPTRPHPTGPHHPPMNRIAAPVLGLFDRAADSLTDRPTTVDELDE